MDATTDDLTEALPHVLLVPVKPPAVGKSRLVGITDQTRQALAVAFALDTVDVALDTAGVARVLALTDDAAFARRLQALGCSVLPDGHSGDLNASLRLAAAEARRRWPELRPAALCADLPALRRGDLAEALRRSTSATAAFVADRAGVGTTFYTASYDAFLPRFGGASRAAHLDEGAQDVSEGLDSLRADVDDLADLAHARDLGLGRHTAAVEMA